MWWLAGHSACAIRTYPLGRLWFSIFNEHFLWKIIHIKTQEFIFSDKSYCQPNVIISADNIILTLTLTFQLSIKPSFWHCRHSAIIWIWYTDWLSLYYCQILGWDLEVNYTGLWSFSYFFLCHTNSYEKFMHAHRNMHTNNHYSTAYKNKIILK